MGHSILALYVLLQGAQAFASLQGTVRDETRQPVAGVEVTLRLRSGVLHTTTNSAGQFRFNEISQNDSDYNLDFEKSGFFRLAGYVISRDLPANEIDVTLNHEYEVRSSVDVVATPREIVPAQSEHHDELIAQEIRQTPVPSSHTLENALPSIPGVVQDTSGRVHVAGAREEDTLYLLDGFQINNPSTGLLDARISVDSVRDIRVLSGRYDASLGSAGVLEVESDSGDDHWRFGTTNFLPSFDLERGIHLANWFPRTNFSGPIRRGTFWFYDSLSLQHHFSLVRELPKGSDTSESWSGDNLLRLQYNITPSQSLHGNFLYNGATGKFEGLGPYVPVSATTDSGSHRYFVSVRDQILLERGVIEFGVSTDGDRLNRTPRGSQTYVITPSGPQGNYYKQVLTTGNRWQGRAALTLLGRRWYGVHDLGIGANADRTHLDQNTERHSIEIRASDSSLVRSVDFAGPGELAASELHVSGYVRDSWQLRPSIVVNSSLGIDRNDVTRDLLAQPRVIVNWIPYKDATKFSLGWGLYYQPVYLSLIEAVDDQRRMDFIPGATVPLLTTLFVRPPSLKQPYFETVSAEWQQQWTSRTASSIHAMRRLQKNGLVYEKGSGDPAFQTFELNNFRQDRYDALEFSLRHTFNDKADAMVAYTYSRARSNKIFDYGTDSLLLTPQASGPLSWDTPHRVVSRGSAQTNIWELLFSYFAEYHSGFPFSAVDSRYYLAGAANDFRYPYYFSLNVAAEKRFPFHGYQWAVRLSVINATGRHNSNAVINNVDSPDFLAFAGGQSRSFTARLRLVGRK